METNSVMVVDREDLVAPEVGFKDPDFEKEDFENWTKGGEELIDEIRQFHGLGQANYPEIYKTLKRHYIEKHGESRKLFVLPPKKRGE